MFQEVIKEVVKSVDLQPLQYLAAVRVAITVCESEDVQCMIGRFHKTTDEDGMVGFLDGQWRQLHGKAKRKLNQIGIPDLIIDIILENLWPIGFEISKWILCHVEDMGIECSTNFCWAPQVNIDYEKTAAILTKNVAIEIINRFKLTCIYCLDFEVRSLWDQMSLSQKRSFFVRGNLKKVDQNLIIIYWTSYVQDVPMEFWDSKVLDYAELFKYAVENGYLSATKYFFGKLDLELRQKMITNSFYIYFRNLYQPDCNVRDHLAIACFLASELRSDLTGIFYAAKLDLVFLYFLEWPMQKHFKTVINRLESYLRANICGELLKRIIEKDTGCFKDHDYKGLFRELWAQMPATCKTYVNTGSSIGFRIFMTFVKKHFGFIFDEESFVLKAKFRDVVSQQEISVNVTEKENIEFFKFLVRERVTTKTFIDIFSYFRSINLPLREFGKSFSNEQLKELLNLMDGILEIV